jgi:hypothetical protein
LKQEDDENVKQRLKRKKKETTKSWGMTEEF